MRRLVLAFLALAAGCDRQPAPSNPAARVEAPAPVPPAPAGKLDRSRAGKAAPQIEFQDPDGETVTLASFEGKPVLLNFWATWCGPCVKEMPTLDRLAARQGGRLQVIALSQDDGGREKVDAFMAKAKLSAIEPYTDSKLAAMGALGVEVLPTTILFDAKGLEIWRVTGELDWTSPKAAALVGEAVSPR
jgi:thiol-disulfide isomerase/thioredoxin